MQIFDGNSSYHSLQVTANRRFARGLQFGVSFTHSKAMDYAEGDSTSTSGAPSGATNVVALYQNRATYNYGLAGYDRPNILTFHFLWDLPRASQLVSNKVVKALFDGWQLSDITTFESGAPLTITMTESPTVNFLGGGDPVRPLMVGNPNGAHTFYNWFNAAAFAEPTPMSPSACASGTCPAPTLANLGDMSESPIRGPGVNNFNTSVYKNFTIKERFRCQFRAEAYNTFNHTQFSGINTSIVYNAAGQNTNAATGNVTSTATQRELQLALRIIF